MDRDAEEPGSGSSEDEFYMEGGGAGRRKEVASDEGKQDAGSGCRL